MSRVLAWIGIGLAVASLTGCYVTMGGSTEVAPGVSIGTAVDLDPKTGETSTQVGGSVTVN